MTSVLGVELHVLIQHQDKEFAAMLTICQKKHSNILMMRMINQFIGQINNLT